MADLHFIDSYLMRLVFFPLYIVVMMFTCRIASGQLAEKDTFRWGGVTYINMSVGEKVKFRGEEVELLSIRNHFNRIRINGDTAWIKVCYRAPVSLMRNMQVFVADNRNVKSIVSNRELHGLLTKDALIALCPLSEPLIDQWQFVFPVSFSGGYIWRNDEDSYIFSYQGGSNRIEGMNVHFPGLALDMKNARGSSKFGILAMEAGRIAWINSKMDETGQPKAALCLASDSFPGIYYIYQNLYSKYVFVKPHQKVKQGDELGYIWGDGPWENLQLSVIRSDTVPDFNRRNTNLVNFFPQLMELYYGRQPAGGQMFTKGQILFGIPTGVNGNKKNVAAYENYQGTGWILGNWNTADKVEWVSTRTTGNARLSKTLFEGQPARCTNPLDWYEYEIDVDPGIYRIRASVGDCLLPSWQKVEFEGVIAGTYELDAGEFTWTPERIVKVQDGRLTVRIYLADQSRKAGINQIVFQQAN